MIENYLLRGKQNARTRRDLCILTGMSDRDVRQKIEELRASGVFVCTDEDGNGYYISEDTQDLLRQYKKNMARIRAISKRTKPIRDYLKSKGVTV